MSGRRPSRDPIGEDGGINRYGFVGNDGVNRADILGLAWDSSKGQEAVDLAMKIQKDGPSAIADDHVCCDLIRKCGEKATDCITYAAAIIKCGYLLSGDKVMAAKMDSFNKNTFNAKEVSKALAGDGWKMVVYAKDSRRAYATYPTNAHLPKPNPDGYVSGEGIAGTFGSAIRDQMLYGMIVHGAIYDLDPYPISGETRKTTVMPVEKFGFLSGANGYHTGLISNGDIYNTWKNNPIEKWTMNRWINSFDATQIGWMMLAPDSNANLKEYKTLLDAVKKHKSPKVIKK